MKPPTPKQPAHDHQCPHCGEWFTAARFMDYPLGDYHCNRCNTRFQLIGTRYYVAGIKVHAWIGNPMPASVN